MVAGEIISTVLRAARIGRVGLGTTLIAIVYACILSSFSLIFFIGGYRVLKQLRLVSTPQDSETRESLGQLVKMTAFLIASGVCNFVFILGFIISAVESFAYSPVGFHVCWSILYLGLLSGSLVQCLAVRMPDFGTHTSKGVGTTCRDDGSSQKQMEDEEESNKKHRQLQKMDTAIEVDVSLEGTLQSEG